MVSKLTRAVALDNRFRSLDDENRNFDGEKRSLDDENWNLDGKKWSLDDENWSLDGKKWSLDDENWSLDSKKGDILAHLTRQNGFLRKNNALLGRMNGKIRKPC